METPSSNSDSSVLEVTEHRHLLSRAGCFQLSPDPSRLQRPNNNLQTAGLEPSKCACAAIWREAIEKEKRFSFPQPFVSAAPSAA